MGLQLRARVLGAPDSASPGLVVVVLYVCGGVTGEVEDDVGVMVRRWQ